MSQQRQSAAKEFILTTLSEEVTNTHFQEVYDNANNEQQLLERKVASFWDEDKEQRNAFYEATHKATDQYFEMKTQAMEQRKEHSVSGAPRPAGPWLQL